MVWDNCHRYDRCLVKMKYPYSVAVESMKSLPCSNVSMQCPLCQKSDPAIWKYFMKNHFEDKHKSQKILEYSHLWRIMNFECDKMRKIWVKHSVGTVKPAKGSSKGARRIKPLLVGKRRQMSLRESELIVAYMAEVMLEIEKSDSVQGHGGWSNMVTSPNSHQEPMPDTKKPASQSSVIADMSAGIPANVSVSNDISLEGWPVSAAGMAPMPLASIEVAQVIEKEPVIKCQKQTNITDWLALNGCLCGHVINEMATDAVKCKYIGCETQFVHAIHQQ
ncbi:hypothetical protein BDQ17DRAFT_1332915 [Cyathus striatus]|nr:hypothetical protein BDQ17DRAFT_1332915 [Cyathus striatus]